MHKILLIAVLLNIVVALGQVVSQLEYDIGDELAYNMEGTVDTRGYLTATGQRSTGSIGYLNGTIVVQCTDEDSESYLFVMNIWGANVNVGQGPASAIMMDPSLNDDDDGDWLGYDMYYQQNKTGEIVEIWYQDGDSPYFVNVKLGAINSLQTHIVAPSTTAQFIQNDPVGSHYSTFTGSAQADSSLEIQNAFTEKDFLSFPDTNLQQSNVQINALTTTTITSDGYIESSSLTQMVNLVDMTPGSSQSQRQDSKSFGDVDNTALNAQFSSFGNMTVDYAPSGADGIPKRAYSAKTFNDLRTNATFKSGSLTDIASQMMFFKRAQEVKVKDILAQILRHPETVKVKTLKKLIAFVNSDPKEAKHILAVLRRLDLNNIEAIAVSKLFYVLSGLNLHEALLSFANIDYSESVQLAAVTAFHNTEASPELLEGLLEINANTDLGSSVRRAAMYAYGALVGKSQNEDVRVKAARVLMSSFFEAVSHSRVEDIITVMHAIGNAGPSVISAKLLPITLATSDNADIRVAFANAMRKYTSVPTIAAVLTIMLRTDTDPRVQQIVKSLVPSVDVVTAQNSDFPFNKSYTANYTLGGSEVSAVFQGELFAGTNFDCNEQTFNYEALALAEVTVSAWSFTKNAFLAKGIYGQANGVVVGNELFLQIWDDVVYDQAIPTIDCNQHTYELYQTGTGISVSYVLWVSIIPVVFSADVSVGLNIQWAWQICDTQLSALVELIPTGTVEVDGTAEVDLLIIKAGVELSGSFNAEIIPQGYIQGTECTVGFDIEESNDPMDIAFTDYYAWDQCKYWIFDCHWGDEDVHTIWEYDVPSNSQVLYDQQWKISP